MNVLFVNEYCGYVGGVEQNVVDTAAGLRSRGHTCVLAFAADTLGRDPEEYAAHFDGAVACGDLRGPGTTTTPTLADAVAHARPDVVFFHKVPRLPRLAAGTRTVRMIHDHDLCCPRRHKYSAWTGRACPHRIGWRCYLDAAFVARDSSARLGLRLVNISGVRRELQSNADLDALIVGSRFMYEELLHNGLAGERIHVLPPMVRLAPIQPTPLPPEPRILYVGQLVHGKGVDLLLGALARLQCDFRATIVGSGNARSSLERRCRRLRLDTQVTFTGWVPHSDLDRYYADARLVVVPSRWPEPFGMVGLEAMHHARPVVAFATGGIPDWLEHRETGLLAPAQNTTALARSIESVLTDHVLAATLGRTARRRLRERFSFDSYLDRLECILDPERTPSNITTAQAPLGCPSTQGVQQ